MRKWQVPFATLAAVFSFCLIPSCGARDVLSGFAFENQTQASFNTGLGVWDSEKHTAVVGFVSKPLSNDEINKILKYRSFFLAMIGRETKSPVIELNLVFQPDRTTAKPEYLERYNIAFLNYPESPTTLNFQSSQWSPKYGILELSGDLRKGGILNGKFKLEHYPFNLPGKAREYQWDLSFKVKLR